MTQPLNPDKELVAYCELCDSISVPSTIGEDCDDCEDGYYEKYVSVPCDKGDECPDTDHHYGLDIHLYRPEDVPEDV